MDVETMNPADHLELVAIACVVIAAVLVTAKVIALARRAGPRAATPREIVLALAAQRRLVGKLGFRFQPERDSTCLHSRFNSIDLMQKGTNGYTENHYIGRVDGHQVVACEYHYETGSSGRDIIWHSYGIVFVLVPLMIPEVRIRPKKTLDEIATTVGLEEIEFESAEFSRRYHVSATNRRFAYDLIHARAMEHLLEHPDYSWEFDGDTFATYWPGGLLRKQALPAIQAATGFVKLIPEFIWEQYGFTPREGQHA